MLKRLYVDNFKCMVNCEFSPRQTQLLLGANGTGKSSFFDVLFLLRQLISGEGKVAQLFPSSCLTRWERREKQTFELEVEGEGGVFQYKLVLEHRAETRQCKIGSETLSLDGRPLLKFEQGDVTIYREDQRKGSTFAFDWGQSVFVTLLERSENRLHHWFKKWVSQIQVVRLNPFSMASETDHEEANLDRHGTNFASWYRYLIQETPELIEQVRQTLAAIWDGFQGIRLKAAGPNVRVFKAMFADASVGDGTSYLVALDELSDGQRALIALYTFLRYAERTTHPLICFDEPDNFVSLAEIQPWLMDTCRAVEDHGSQALFISHHPELINYLAPQDAVILSRDDGGPTRIRPFTAPNQSTLTPAEVIARGWESE